MRLVPSTHEQAEHLAAMMRDFYAGDPSMKPMDADSTLPKVKKLLQLNGKDVYLFSIHKADSVESTGSAGLGLDASTGPGAPGVSGEPHGYVLVTYFYSNEYDGNVALLDELYIAPAYRGQGAGGKVMQILLRWVAEQGFCAAVLETTPDNDRARALYARNGFSEINRILMGKFDIGL